MEISPQPLLTIADFAGTAVFAATGVLASARRRMDWIGALVLAIVTATGGGTLRDLLTGQLPVFWIRQPIYLWIATGTALVMLPLLHKIRFPERALLLPDAIGLALYTWIGCEKAQLLGLAGIVVALLGVMTGTAGGLIRDVLSAQVPNILRKGELYAAASIPGAVVFVVLKSLQATPHAIAAACMLTVLAIRLAAIRWHLTLPTIPEDSDSGRL
jgi:uncharacterized membrane protein YeiH